MRTVRQWMIMVGVLSGLLLPHDIVSAAVTNVYPTAGPPGTQFLFFASGFAANEPISIWLNAPDGRILPASAPELRRTTAQGDATWTWKAPDDAPLGAWQMVAHGRQSTIEQVIPFRIAQAMPPADSNQPFAVFPAGGQPGTLFRFFATGFTAGEAVGVSVSGPAGPLESPDLITAALASPAGRFDGSWASPRDAAPGAWQIVLRGKSSDVVRAIPVSISPAPARPPAQMAVQPSTGRPGARFVVSATGFGANELISVWLNAPDGRVLAAEVEGRAQAGPDGRAGWGWVAPEDAPLGAWQMVAHGRDSGIEVVANFTLS